MDLLRHLSLFLKILGAQYIILVDSVFHMKPFMDRILLLCWIYLI